MKFVLNNDVLRLILVGEINSMTASSVEAEIDKTLENKTFSSLVLDFEQVSYVSSAGLRVVLKLKQKYGNVSIINASIEVYDILEMTGFIDIMPISKILRKIDVSKAEVIGEGYFSVVYRIDKDTIIKVFKRATDTQDIQRELNLAKQAFVLGIPTAISFDIVMVGDKYGVVFEMLDSVSLRDLFRDHPEKYDSLIDKYAALLKKINTTEPTDNSLPNAKEKWLEKLELIKPHFDENQYKKALNLLNSIPEKNTFVHGDCHFKNIMTQGDDLFLIDMDTLSKGHEIFELAAIYAPYVAFDEDDPGNTVRFLGVSKELATNIYHDVVKKYLGNDKEENYDKIKLVSYIHMMWWNRVNEPSNNVRLEGCKSRLLPLLEKYNDLNLG